MCSSDLAYLPEELGHAPGGARPDELLLYKELIQASRQRIGTMACTHLDRISLHDPRVAAHIEKPKLELIRAESRPLNLFRCLGLDQTGSLFGLCPGVSKRSKTLRAIDTASPDNRRVCSRISGTDRFLIA